jgi:predicted HTH transcriptional regulator
VLGALIEDHIALPTLSERLMAQIRLQKECSFCAGLPQDALADLVRIAFDLHPTIRKQFRWVHEELWRTDQESAKEKIVSLLKKTPSMTPRQLAEQLGITEGNAKHHLDRLRTAGRLRHVGPTKGGRWEVLK